MKTKRPALRELADRAGILPSFRQAGSGTVHHTSDATRERLLEALGLEAGSEAAARRSLAALEATDAETRAPFPTGATGEAPGRAFEVERIQGGRRLFGLWANLYSLRGERDLGVGDLGDLRELVSLAGDAGAAFVGLSPLHAQRNRGDEISPYMPVSRVFRNPLYLDVDSVPEADDPAFRALRESAGTRAEIEALRRGDRIDPEGTSRLKERLVSTLHAAFLRRHAGGETDRARAFAAYRRDQGALLDDWATFSAIEASRERRLAPRGVPAWPHGLQDPRSAEVARFREANALAVDRHRFAQFELDRQLARVAEGARSAGMALGLYSDLALGGRDDGFDTWAFPDLFVRGVSVGAPPDEYASEGQDWGFPPLHPGRLADDDFAFLRRILRAAAAHAGAVRIDHVLGFYRQWWIPRGRPATEGAYVRFPARDLLRVACEESRRAAVVLVGEDLGTVPPYVAPSLARSGVLSSRVLLFERESSGRFKPASRWSGRALGTVDTHDLPTLRAWIEGHDLLLRRSIGLLPDDASLDAARAERAKERSALERRLVRDGWLSASDPRPRTWSRWARAAHAFLCSTPSPLVGLSLDDLAGEVEPVNLPGVGPDRWPSWTRRMACAVERLPGSEGFEEALSGAASRGARCRT